MCERRGIAGARMEEVAALARVSKGTLYRHFASKEDLFLATLIRSYEESTRLIDQDLDLAADPAVRLDHLLEGLGKVLASVAPRMTIHYQAWGLIATDPVRRARLYGYLRDFHVERGAQIADAVRDGQRRGRFATGADPDTIADGIMALLGGFLYRATFDPRRASPEHLRAALNALVRDGLRGGRRPSSGVADA